MKAITGCSFTLQAFDLPVYKQSFAVANKSLQAYF